MYSDSWSVSSTQVYCNIWGRGGQITSALFPQQLFADCHDFAAYRGVEVDCLIDLFAGVEHGAVVAAPEQLADFEQRGLGLLTNQIHRHLPWFADVFVALFTADIVQ